MKSKKTNKLTTKTKKPASARVLQREKLLKSALAHPGVKEAMEVYKASVKDSEQSVDVYEVERQSISFLYP